jgi:hypothetical protein
MPAGTVLLVLVVFRCLADGVLVVLVVLRMIVHRCCLFGHDRPRAVPVPRLGTMLCGAHASQRHDTELIAAGTVNNDRRHLPATAHAGADR